METAGLPRFARNDKKVNGWVVTRGIGNPRILGLCFSQPCSILNLYIFLRSVIMIIHYGVGFGAILAMVISFSVNKSVLWAIIHGLFGWFYVLYYLLFRG